MKKFITNVDLDNNRIVNLSNPIDQLDGISKDYLDDTNVDNFDVYNYNYSSLTTTPPTSGEIRLNSLTFSSATQSYINITDLNSFDVTDTLNNLYQNQRIRIQQKSDKSKFVIYEITDTTDNTSYHSLNLDYIKESTISGPDQDSDCIVIFENIFSFTGTGTASTGGIVPNDGVSGTGLRLLLDDGTWDSALTGGNDTTLHFHNDDRARANHTGTQLTNTISDFNESVDDRVSTLIQDGTDISWTYDDVANTLTANYTAVSGNLNTATLSTTNDTPQTIDTITIPDNETSLTEVYIKAKSGTASGVWKRTIATDKNSGILSIMGISSDIDFTTSEFDSTNISLSNVSNNIDIIVTGIIGSTIDWKSSYEIIL